MSVELGLVEQRVAVVGEVLNEGVAVAEGARRYGVTRQTVHRWLPRFAAADVSAPGQDLCHCDGRGRRASLWW